MKKLFYLLFLLPIAMFSSCSNDDELANVDLTLTLDGVTQTEENGIFYTVEGNDITIEGVDVKSLSGKDAILVNVIYYFQGYPLIGNPANPFLGTFSTEDLEPGTYNLSLRAEVLEVDKSITSIATNYPIVVVKSSEDLPANAPEIGSYSVTLRLQPEKK